jgi:type I restriction enzyme S subunit
MATWERIRLGDHVRTQKGYAFKSGWYLHAGRPIVRVSDFTDDSVDSSKLVCIPEEIASEYLKYELKKGDVVVQTVGSWPTNPASVVGKCVRIPSSAAGALLNQNAVKLSAVNEIDTQFIFYLLRNDDFKTYIVGTAQGAASQAAITLEAIRAYDFNLPSLPVQLRITRILSAYDDLIENNTRRVKILEEMAQALYREWFVQFRFPGHEKVKIDLSPLGPIPQGWQFVPLALLVDFAKGRKPKETRHERLPGDVKLLLIDSLHGGDAVFTPPDKLVLAETRDTIMVMDGASSCEVTIGSSGAVGSTLGRFRTTKPNAFSPHELYQFLKMKTEDFKSKNVGAAIPHANKDYILTQPITLAPEGIASRLHAQLEPIQSMVEVLNARVLNLRRTRDLLLPKLISGEVDVSHFE